MQINYVCHPTLYFYEMLMTVARTIQLRYDRSAQFTVERGVARQAPDPKGLAAGADLKRSVGVM